MGFQVRSFGRIGILRFIGLGAEGPVGHCRVNPQRRSEPWTISYSTRAPDTANPRKLEHGFRRIRARIPYTLP